MYILNPESIPKEKIYWCCGIIAEWLMENKKIPILCRKDRMFGFMKTESLNDALKNMPFWLRLSKAF